jgi:hypothetical protein
MVALAILADARADQPCVGKSCACQTSLVEKRNMRMPLPVVSPVLNAPPEQKCSAAMLGQAREVPDVALTFQMTEAPARPMLVIGQ